MKGKLVLLRTVQVVSFLLGAFSGFLTKIAPPDEMDPKFAVGLASITTLCILLLISGFYRKLGQAKHYYKWALAAMICLILGVASALFYWQNLNRLTFQYAGNESVKTYVNGTELTVRAKAYIQAHESISKVKLVADFGGPVNKGKVWLKDSIDQGAFLLLINYLLTVIFFCSAIFSLCETLQKK